MDIANVVSSQHAFKLTWADRQTVCVPYIWLRDNDPEELHPETKERTFDLTSVALDIMPVSFEFNPKSLTVRWPQLERTSIYSSDWLWRHQPGRTRSDAALVDAAVWDADSRAGISVFDAAKVEQDETELLALLRELKRSGIILIAPLNDSDAGDRFGDLIGFKRRSNFGKIFEVINKPEPNNLAYTSLALPLHTDLSSQEIIPGYQFLHCLVNQATGGDSIFADGFKVCQEFRRDHHKEFALLTQLEVPWRFHDESCEIIRHRPVIILKSTGQIDTLVFNAHLADVPDFDADTLLEFYRAYQLLMKKIRNPKYQLHHRLQSGEMVVFDNRRILHGRTEFNPNSGNRHLRGFYIERNEVDSKMRVLSRAL